MADEYTPTTEDVALAWARDRHAWIGPEYISPQFNRWLAGVVSAERERCARVAEADDTWEGDNIAAAIRGETYGG